MLLVGIFALIALAGQWAKSHRGIPTWAPQVIMGALGLVAYAWVNSDWPKGVSYEALSTWFDHAWGWTLAAPGGASFAGLIPALKTDSRGPAKTLEQAAVDSVKP